MLETMLEVLAAVLDSPVLTVLLVALGLTIWAFAIYGYVAAVM